MTDAQIQAEKESELLEQVEHMARQHCYTNTEEKVYNGVKEVNITDSGALSANADALHILAEHGRFRIVRERGRMVVGYWPENDPEKTDPTVSRGLGTRVGEA